MGPFLVAIVAIIAWAVVQASQNWAKGASKSVPSAEQQELLQEVLHELEAAQADRNRLNQRVQNLEAIVTTETFDLALEDPEAAAAELRLPDAEADERPEDRVERIARRVRP